MLRLGECDLALAGGVSESIHTFGIFASFNSQNALASHDDGSGPLLYAGGSFSRADGETVNGIARWDGTVWTGLGSGVNRQPVRALASYDDGQGNALYVGGDFGSVGGLASAYIAKYSCAPGLVFADGFESGTVSRWSQSVSSGSP